MRTITLGEIKEVIGAELVQGDPGVQVDRVSIDTRTMTGGELFFALRGARFDGHDYVRQAVAAGAAGVVVHREVAVRREVPVLRVNDTLSALQDLARTNVQRCGLPVIAITGSTGKTTTKDLVAAVLATRLRVLATRENLNNHIGLPLTLLEIGPAHQVAVVELAMRGPGEIDLLAKICRPTGGVITNVGETHLELLGAVENIARAKGELLDHIPDSGFALLHADSLELIPQAGRCRGRVIYFGETEQAQIRLVSYRATARGSVFRVRLPGWEAEYALPLLGRHTAVNALAAVGTGLEFGLTEEEIRAGLANVRLSSLRQAIVETGTLTIINDSYNASPASVRAALEVLRDFSGGRPTVAVLGGMLELGPREVAAHREVGQACVQAAVDYLITVGELALGIADGARAAGLAENRIHCCHTTEEAVAAVRRVAPAGAVVLVKGSRYFRMEKVVEGLTGTGRRQERHDPAVTAAGQPTGSGGKR